MHLRRDRFRKKFLIPLASLTLLGACQSAPDTREFSDPLTPPPAEVIDPTDYELQQSVKTALSHMQAPLHSTYDVRRIDLNEDGRRDALVLFKTPYGYWCGKDGCMMLVMQAHNDHFTLVNSIQPVRPPIYSSAHSTQGWQDILIRVSGRWDEAKTVAMRFDGHEYPLDPSDIEPAAGDQVEAGRYLFR